MMMSLSNVFVLTILCFIGAVYAEGPKDPTIVLLDSVGKIWETFNEAKITEVAGQHGETGRGKKMMQMAIPLIVGFKLAGIIIAALGALKVLVVKTVFVSGIAILASLALAGKYLLDSMKKKQHVEAATPYYYPQAQIMAQPMAWDPMYDVSTASADVSSVSDLQGHFSQSILSSSTDNHTAFNFIPIAERKSQRPLYKTTVYKTTVKQIEKKK